MTVAQPRPFPVLLVEDDEHDIRAISRVWEGLRPDHPLIVVQTAEECLAYLRREGIFADGIRHPWPGILLLDLELPGLKGLGLLRILKTAERFRRLPVVVLTQHGTRENVRRAYDLGASSVVVKPTGVEPLREALARLVSFWEAASLPDPTDRA